MPLCTCLIVFKAIPFFLFLRVPSDRKKEPGLCYLQYRLSSNAAGVCANVIELCTYTADCLLLMRKENWQRNSFFSRLSLHRRFVMNVLL